jgi:hypothetical protein
MELRIWEGVGNPHRVQGRRSFYRKKILEITAFPLTYLVEF